MFNQRQLEILLELCENAGQFMTASYFVEKQGVSLRTIQNDMKAIRQGLEGNESASFESVVPKGSRIVVRDPESFATLRGNLYQQYSNTSATGQDERVSQLLLLLLQQHRALSLYDAETSLFVSRSTLFGDLKKAEEILAKYDLELLRSSNKLLLDGSEINKRRCLYEEHLLLAGTTEIISGKSDDGELGKIREILVGSFVAHKRTVSEVALNNAIVQLFVSVKRMENWFFIEEGDLDAEQYLTAGQASRHPVSEESNALPKDTKPVSVHSLSLDDRSISEEQKISEEVFRAIGREFLIRVPPTEVQYFALYMMGAGNYTEESVITPEINDLVLDGLRYIRTCCGVDLTDDLNLRISLGLHLTSLVIRIRYDMQLTNHLVDYIRQTYPQGYDIATYFAAFLQERCGKKVHDEEIAFLAIHLYKSLSDLQRRTGTKKLLVISSLRRSENILLRQTILDWFQEQIAELYFVYPEEMTAEFLDRYDTFVTTEKGQYYEMGLALYISPFPSRQDYLNLKIAMDGFESVKDVLVLFREDLFFTYQKSDRDTVLADLCSRSSEALSMEGLQEAVMRREAMGSTYFGNQIAAAHPHAPLSSDTFIAAGICRRPIVWDEEENKVNIVLLVHIGKNNPKAFQLWNYLSRIITSTRFAENLLADPTYSNFIYLIQRAISEENRE